MTCRDKILSNDFVDLITDFTIPDEYIEDENNDTVCFENAGAGYYVIHVREDIVPPVGVSNQTYHFIPKLYGLMQERFDPIALIDTGILQTQRAPLNLTGEGVILAFIDTGIDYQSDVFKNLANDTRILAIWDQTIQNGTPPEGYEYGTLYTREMINAALEAPNPLEIVPTRDENGHGTRMASVAAGSVINGGNTFRGAAYESDIIVVKLKQAKQYLRDYYLIPDNAVAFQENDIMMALKFVDSYASGFTRPIVICLGIGSNMGDHTGSGALASYLNILARRRGRAVVVAGGNEGNKAHHFQGELEENGQDEVQVRVGGEQKGFQLEMWGNLPDVLYASVNTPGGESVPRLQLRLGQSITYSFVYEDTILTVDSVLVEQSSGEQLIVFRLENPTPGIWTFRVYSDSDIHNGTFHMWLPITQFLEAETEFLEPSPYVTLTEPSMASEVITTGFFNDEDGGIAPESGRGYSRSGDIKPELSSPGVQISTIQGRVTGSSMAAALMGGAVAQLMQWAVVEGNNRLIESNAVKSYFIRGAIRNEGIEYPNREEGYGRLDIAAVFEAISNIT